METSVPPRDLYPDAKTVADIDAILRTDWLLDLEPDERQIAARFPDHAKWVDKLREAYERAHSRRSMPSSIDEREIWRLMARPSLFALRGSGRRHFILDGIAMGVGIARRFAVESSILDVGCHLGVTASVLARFLPNQIIGIDPIGAVIDAARALNVGVPNLLFFKSMLPWTTDRRFGLILCYDVLKHLSEGEQRRAIASLAELTLDDGLVVLSGSPLADPAWVGQAAPWMSDGGLGFVACDVHGGYGGSPLAWIANPVVVLRKGSQTPLPLNLDEQCKREWEVHFRDYANAPTTPRREATQAFERARRLAA